MGSDGAALLNGTPVDDVLTALPEVATAPEGRLHLAEAVPAIRKWPGSGVGNLHTYAVLIRLDVGTVWFLQTSARPWSPDLVEEAARYLSSEGRPGVSSDALENRLAYHLGLPEVRLPFPALPHSSDADWDIPRLALAIATAKAVELGTALELENLRNLAAAEEAALRAELACSLSEFTSALYPDCLGLALRDGRLDTDIYNYLATRPHSAWRIQAARTFPIFLKALATGKPRDDATRIREAVDAGRPLVKELAAFWNVGPSAIKALIGRGPELIGSRWLDAPRQLARALDALPPEDRPADRWEDWERLGQAIDTIRRILGHPDGADILSRRLLREMGRRRFQNLSKLEAIGGQLAGAAGAIALLRRMLIAALDFTAQREARLDATESRSRAVLATDHLISHLKLQVLVDSARRFGQEYAALPVHQESEFAAEMPGDFWPLMPADFTTANGLRRITALTSRQEIASIGNRMGLCIEGGSELARTVRACQDATTFMLLVSDAASHRPMSVAEIRLYRTYRQSGHDLVVVQHRGMQNSRASPGCVRALHELLDTAKKPAGMGHLDRGLVRVRQAKGAPRETRLAADHRALVNALRQSVGPARYNAAAIRVVVGPDRCPGEH